MADEAAPQKAAATKAAPKKAAPKKDAAKKDKTAPKEGKPGWLSRLAAIPRMISAAGCASCLTSVFLMLLVIGVWIVFYFEPGNLPWRHAMSWWGRSSTSFESCRATCALMRSSFAA